MVIFIILLFLIYISGCYYSHDYYISDYDMWFNDYIESETSWKLLFFTTLSWIGLIFMFLRVEYAIRRML